MIASEWVFRHAGGCLIESPELAPAKARGVGGAWCWVATVWPDDSASDGWGASEWERAERGWWLPPTLAIGDVVEFGVTWPDDRQPPIRRWYGWLQRCTVHALVLVGPFEHPALALESATPTIDELRLAQLAAVESSTVAVHSELG